MQLYTILAQNEVTARGLRVWLDTLGEGPVDGPVPVHQIVWPQYPKKGINQALEIYETLVQSIGALVTTHGCRSGGTAVLVDSVDPDALDAGAEDPSWDSLVAMLILTFPDVHWIFGTFAAPAKRMDKRAECWARIQKYHSLGILLCDPLRCPLFDPTGLRDWVRNTTSRSLAAVQESVIVERARTAAAIDEELPYAFLHGYTAYRFGFRTDVVTSWALMKTLFGNRVPPQGYTLLFEDISLKFPDRPRQISLLSLKDRDEALPGLNALQEGGGIPNRRIIITSGHDALGGSLMADNERYLARQQPKRPFRLVYKPAGGMFDLWQKAGLSDCGGSNDSVDQVLKGFHVPSWESGPVANRRAHGTDGRTLRIAEALIRRTEAIAGQVESVEAAVLGAVLSGDAFELSGGITPTTAINALVMKHRFEVEAECKFSGVEYHFDVRSRLAEIFAECKLVSKSFHPKRRRKALLNSEMRVIHGLLNVLRANGQFDEEQTCLARVRVLHLNLWSDRNRARYLLWPFLRYLILLFQSPAHFALAICFWVIGLAAYFHQVNAPICYSWRASFGDAASSFFAIGSPVANVESARSSVLTAWPYVYGIYGAIILGFVHLGVFVSYLYSIISRR